MRNIIFSILVLIVLRINKYYLLVYCFHFIFLDFYSNKKDYILILTLHYITD